MRPVQHLLSLLFSAAVLLSMCANAYAITPQSGWWWNPAEGGRGFTIEAQNGSIFFAAYLYDASGRATWYAAGPAAMSGSTFTAPLRTYLGGQTLTGAYRATSGTADNGNVTITFTDETHGSMTWAGGTVLIQRYEFGTNGLSTANSAGLPQAGWWWNPNEPGRGFSIEAQNDKLFMAGYMYDDAGNPIWYAIGPMPMTSNLNFGGIWQQYGNGQTLTGTYRSASLVNFNVGYMGLAFSSPREATMTLPDGRAISLQRYEFGGGYAAVNPTQGDAYTFNYTFTPTSQTVGNYIFTRYYQTAGSDGSATFTQTFTDTFNSNSTSYDSYGGTTSSSSNATNNSIAGTCTYLPGLRGVSTPYYVGKSWNNSSTATCSGATYSFANKGTIEAVESVTVPAGTFTALREVFTITSVPLNTSNPTTTTTAYTCWRDVNLGRTVKCTWTFSTTPYGSTTATQYSASSIVLNNYSANGGYTSTYNVLRYAGAWSLSLTGSETGSCSLLNITTAGAISGTCQGSLSGTQQATGSVNVFGSFTLSFGNSTLTGVLNPITGSGTWSGVIGSGSWTATHK
ncbi:MAG: hypothetical protein HYS18_06615 [Burkholderiales bacterium]|nr:hypothetical protein [Burkholderiales bacterium]